MKFEWFVATRYLLSRRKQSFISIISIISIAGVGLGVATVILVIAVLDGVEHGLKDRFLANEAHLALRKHGSGFFYNYQDKIQEIKKIEGVAAVSPVVYTQTAVFQQGNNQIEDVILLKGIIPEIEDTVTGFSKFVTGTTDFQNRDLMERASFINDVTITGGIILGSRLAQRLLVNEGDVLRLVIRLVEDPLHADSLFPIVRNFVVVGFYESELAMYDNQLAFIHLKIAQQLYNSTTQQSYTEDDSNDEVADKINLILIRLEDPDLATKIGGELEEAAFNFLDMPIATTWLETHAPLFAALKLEKIATVIIEALIILVAAFNIASTLIMTVMEKTRDVGMLRTLGASRGDIVRIFMIQGSVIGILGTIVGTTLGLGICWLLSTNIIRPSVIYALGAIGILVICQIGIALRRILAQTKLRKIGLFVLWILVVCFGLYCFVTPISLKELGLSEIYQMNQLPIKVNWFFVVFINVLSFAICWIATLYPSWQASNLKPIEALQYE